MKIGIDYSISSPSVYIGDDDFDSGKVLCFRQNKKMESKDNVLMSDYPEYDTKEERYYMLANICVHFILDNLERDKNGYIKERPAVHLEGYAYGATGNVFDIAEATSVLKQLLYHNGFEIKIVEPSVVKKKATGKGNSNKFAMLEAFKDLGYDISSKFDNIAEITDKKIPAPMTDIIDAYFVSRALS